MAQAPSTRRACPRAYLIPGLNSSSGRINMTSGRCIQRGSVGYDEGPFHPVRAERTVDGTLYLGRPVGRGISSLRRELASPRRVMWATRQRVFTPTGRSTPSRRSTSATLGRQRTYTSAGGQLVGPT